MRTIVHLVPYDAVGGVETAARTMSHVQGDGVRFDVVYVFPELTAASPRSILFNPVLIYRCVMKLLKQPVDLIVMSLWRSALVGIAYKILRPRVKLVLFLHNTRSAHLLDAIITRIAAIVANEIWSDATSTMSERLPHVGFKGRVISYLPEHLTPLPFGGEVTPSFVFWGRLVSQKNLGRALRLFAEIQRERSEATLSIIGPDGGELSALRELSSSLGIASAVVFLGQKSMAEIREAVKGKSFYFQTSEFEGMGLSVVEAMQLGLIPVVTSVGEIANYCRHRENALIITSKDKLIRDLNDLLDRADVYVSMREAAIATWQHRQVYRDSVLDACIALLD